MAKEKTYRCPVTWRGEGYALITATSKKQAIETFMEGEFDDIIDGDRDEFDFETDRVEEVK